MALEVGEGLTEVELAEADERVELAARVDETTPPEIAADERADAIDVTLAGGMLVGAEAAAPLLMTAFGLL